ncbi:MAG TPA: hypothetical protein EYG92_09690 [Lutibacter sp.]|nr:hypothetical protein [Lutibacter sp.]
MRVITKPIIEPSLVYSKCLNSIANRAKRDNFRSVKEYVKIKSEDYNAKATIGDLYTISIHSGVNAILTTDDMKKVLYGQQMLGKPKGRKIYDNIMSLAPLDRCPFCGIGTVSTLDHYLPKVKFPTFSVLPYNLVPSCKDCNTGKSTSYATTKEGQTLHPYYDDFTDEQWLFAKVLKTSPVSIKFFINTPNNWDDISKSRVDVHFIDYDLGKRFSIESINELAKLNSSFRLFPLKKRLIKKQLNKQALTMKKIHLNSWESALYQALSESDWYCNGGFNE